MSYGPWCLLGDSQPNYHSITVGAPELASTQGEFLLKNIPAMRTRKRWSGF
jgi:hypothetical protein